MSLRPDDRSSRRRDRSHSRSRDERSRSRDDRKESRRQRSPPDEESHTSSRHAYPVSDAAGTASMNMPSMPSMPAMPSMPPMPGGFDDDIPYGPPRDSLLASGYSSHHEQKHSTSPPAGGVPYPTSSFFPDPSQFDITGGSERQRLEESLAFGPSPYDDESTASSRSIQGYRQHDGSAKYVDYHPRPTAQTPPPSAFYADSTSTPHRPSQTHRTSSYDKHDHASSLDASNPYTASARSHVDPSGNHVSTVDFVPGGSRGRSSSNLAPHMDRLTIGGPQQPHAGGLPPPSPLLEPYRGTYQSVSPMMAPMAHDSDSDMSDIDQLSGARVQDFKPSRSSKSSKSDKHSKHDKGKHDKDKHDSDRPSKAVGFSTPSDSKPKEKKRVTLYDPSSDATALSKALSHSHASNIDTDAITKILPELTHDQILALRKEYKTVAKVNGKGVNLSKHLKLKLSGNYGKAAYVTALGRWESEGYWANFFYQSHSSRRELLIEALMGRTNAEVRAIKDDFRDKRYGDDLRKMVERELRADKFRTAVLMVLDEKRQEETDYYGEEVVRRDVQVLAAGLRTTQGGESAMLEVVVKRSDAHLRQVLAVFEKELRVNFAREALKRSGNLVGEVLAHILNGVINRPARDALLLRHAIQDIAEHNKDEELRYELLISRLVRFHWDKAHLEKVKREYVTKNGRNLEDDIAKATKSDFKHFMMELCDPRG